MRLIVFDCDGTLVDSSRLGDVLFEGMGDLLADLALRADVLLGIVTMKSRGGLNDMLEQYQLSSYIAVSKTADDGVQKPNPAMLLEAIEECGVQAKDCLMIGDTIYDIQMAQGAGVIPLGVAWGYQSAKELRQAGAKFIAQNPAELRAYFD